MHRQDVLCNRAMFYWFSVCLTVALIISFLLNNIFIKEPVVTNTYKLVYQANICQFGIDQLPDASTNAIKSFISWFIWTDFTAGGIAGHYIYECIDKQYYVVGQCFISICLSVALIMSFLLNGIFIKKPVVQNPYTSWFTGLSSMLCKTNTPNAEVPLHSVKISFHHVWILWKWASITYGFWQK